MAKKAVKKVANAQLVLTVAPEEHRFWVCNGLVLNDLRDLASALDSMSEEDFMCHANSEKNDFSNWVSEILQDKVLASILKKLKSRESALKAVKARLVKFA